MIMACVGLSMAHVVRIMEIVDGPTVQHMSARLFNVLYGSMQLSLPD